MSTASPMKRTKRIDSGAKTCGNASKRCSDRFIRRTRFAATLSISNVSNRMGLIWTISSSIFTSKIDLSERRRLVLRGNKTENRDFASASRQILTKRREGDRCSATTIDLIVQVKVLRSSAKRKPSSLFLWFNKRVLPFPNQRKDNESVF